MRIRAHLLSSFDAAIFTDSKSNQNAGIIVPSEYVEWSYNPHWMLVSDSQFSLLDNLMLTF